MIQPPPFDLLSYDHYLFQVSGGKDSVAMYLRCLELGVSHEKCEFWHQRVDGHEGSTLFDWPCTDAYVRALARHFEVPVFFQWREGGLERELLRNWTSTAPTWFETPQGLQKSGGDGPAGYRRKYPQPGSNLSTRWCSPAAKIDVGALAIRNQARFSHRKTLVLTGERREESPARAKYLEFERDRADGRLERGKKGRMVGRHNRLVDRWRPVIDFTEEDVWAIIERHKINPHPAYRVGFGRTSCLHCIFGGPEQRAAGRTLDPEGFAKHAAYEKEFGYTIHRKLTVVQIADTVRFKIRTPNVNRPFFVEANNPDMAREKFIESRHGKRLGLTGSESLLIEPAAYVMNEADVKAAMSREFNEPMVLDPWHLPQGAYGDSCGPT